MAFDLSGGSDAALCPISSVTAPSASLLVQTGTQTQTLSLTIAKTARQK